MLVFPGHAQAAKFDSLGANHVTALKNFFIQQTCTDSNCPSVDSKPTLLSQFSLFVTVQYASYYRGQFVDYGYLYGAENILLHRTRILQNLKDDFDTKLLPVRGCLFLSLVMKLNTRRYHHFIVAPYV